MGVGLEVLVRETRVYVKVHVCVCVCLCFFWGGREGGGGGPKTRFLGNYHVDTGSGLELQVWSKLEYA